VWRRSLERFRAYFLLGAFLASGAYAGDRLDIYVLPIEVVHENASGERTYPPEGAIERAMAKTVEAMSVLGVPPDKYNITLSSEPKEQLICGTSGILNA